MSDVLKLLALFMVVVALCVSATVYVAAKAPNIEPSLTSIVHLLNSKHIKPYFMRYGSVLDCPVHGTQAIQFQGVTGVLDKKVSGLVCCSGDTCYVQRLEDSQ